MTIDSKENVVRILANDWVINGVLQQTAFTLRDSETYISVNRPAVTSYTSDVTSFVRDHKNFRCESQGRVTYQWAILNVGDIRDIAITNGEQPLSINVEVEPRDVFTKSHAGIFTRYGLRNIKRGDVLTFDQTKDLSANMVLLKVRLALLRLSTVNTCSLSPID
ncbi:MAG: hypothetical protein IJ693_10250 [Bacteroidaceae bacterium]|nr:hypothetical protein [Bacteroidaceae bacterium]